MPNSGFQGQINQSFYGTHKAHLVPLGDQYVSGNLPNPAFWRRFIRDPVSSIENPSGTRVLTTTEVLAPVWFINNCAANLSKNDRATSNTLPRLHTSSTWTTNEGSDHAPLRPQVPSSARGRFRDAHIPLVALNSLAPFATTYKPTCGYFFSRSTNNKKKQMGIPATDLVKYRYYVK
eukprot:XP_003725491.1 PREDICTED: uncharacterized protein LOC100888047 [Strongylocentrotus purpuratus]